MPARLQHLLRARHAPWWTLLTGLALTAALGWKMHLDAVQMDRQRLAVRVAEVTAQLDARLEKTEMLLHNLRDYLTWSGETHQEGFSRWCYENGLSINCPWLHGVALATNQYVSQWQDRLPAPPRTWAATEWEQFRLLTRTQLVDCHIALTSELKDGNLFRTNYALLRLVHDPDPTANAIRGSRITMGRRTEVILDASSNVITGTIYYLPVYRREVADFFAVSGLTKDQRDDARWMNLTALIMSPVDFDELVRSVWDGVPADLGMEIYSSSNQTNETSLSNSKAPLRATDPRFKAYLTHRQPWPMYGHKFSIFYYTTPLFEAQSPRRLAKIAMITGVIVTLLATALVWLARRAHDRQQLMTEQIRDARDALTVAQRERDRVSRDLHDGAVQSLYSLQLRLDHTMGKLDRDPAKPRHDLPELRRELDGVIAEIRQFITAEKRAEKRFALDAVLKAVVRRAQASSSAELMFHCDPGVADQLTAEQALQFASIAREAMSNSLRHAKPKQVEISLRARDRCIVLEVADDGEGFDPHAPARSGVGLASMQSRAIELGGQFQVQSAPGQGTRVSIRLALEAAACEPEDSEGGGVTKA